MKFKKHSIGYNTVKSVDGVISAKGVKSKANNLQVSGYTHEIGEGEKSPDNPYVLKSLDSGNVNLYSEDKLTTHKVNSATGAIRTGIKLSTPKSSYYCVRWDENTGTRGISYKLVNQTTGIIDGYKMFYVNSFVKVPHGYDIIFYDTGGVGTQKYAFTERTNLMILDSPIMPDEYITDEHSVVLSNNDMSIQVPVPISLNCVEGVSDRIVKKEDGYYVEQNIKDVIINEKITVSIREQKNNYVKFNINVENGRSVNKNKIKCDKLLVKSIYADVFNVEYIRNSTSTYRNLIVAYMLISRFTTNDTATNNEILAYLKDNDIRLLYQVENPYYYKLPDYAQDLLNSFTLQNQNKIWVKGNPDIKVSGYLQK